MAAKKNVWLTWMPNTEDANDQVALAGAALQKVGLAVGGALWNREFSKHGWVELAGTLSDAKGADIWIVAGTKEDLEDKQNRYCLSLVAAMIREQRGKTLPLILVGLDHAPDEAGLPLYLDPVKCIDASKASNWAAKALVAIHSAKPETVKDEFRFSVTAHEYFGQWFEVGPRTGEWNGVMFGVAGDDVLLQEHAVGPIGDIPEKTTLNYASSGIKAEVRGIEFEACSVQNPIPEDGSYWIQVRGQPTHLIVASSHPGAEDQDVWVIDLV